MKYSVWYKGTVIEKDIPRLPKRIAGKIKVAIREKLTTHPERFGKPLRESLKGYRRLRVGDYRVVFRIQDDSVKIFAIQHRSEIYKGMKVRVL